VTSKSAPSRPSKELTERDLHNWRLLDAFQDAVERVFSGRKLPATFREPLRELSYGPYLSLFLFGLFNPVIESMRGVCAISALPRVQEDVCGAKISPASFSEMQHVLDPLLLREVFQDLVARTNPQQKPDPRLAHLNLIAQDGSLWRALPRMVWAEYGVGPKGEANGVRLHLRFNLVEGKPQDATVQRGKSCERQALRQMCVPGQINVGDRYYGEDYKLFYDIDHAEGYFVFRLKESAVINPLLELALTQEDKAAGVVRHLWATLGATQATRSIRVRVVEIRVRDHHLLLVTNLPVEQASAALVGSIYRKRWDIELFFRWIKCILGCRHFFAESPEGVALQLYLALIASLLFQYYSGRRPNKRTMELIQFYLLGWATAEDLIKLLQDQASQQRSGKKA
jgi:hypothetical protein